MTQDMHFDDYIQQMKSFANTDKDAPPLLAMAAIGLLDELRELEILCRDEHIIFDAPRRDELGDVYWYVAAGFLAMGREHLPPYDSIAVDGFHTVQIYAYEFAKMVKAKLWHPHKFGRKYGGDAAIVDVLCKLLFALDTYTTQFLQEDITAVLQGNIDKLTARHGGTTFTGN